MNPEKNKRNSSTLSRSLSNPRPRSFYFAYGQCTHLSPAFVFRLGLKAAHLDFSTRTRRINECLIMQV